MFGEKTGNPGQQFIVFSQNHDQVGNRMLGERSSALVSFEMQKLMAAAVIISPFLPMLFMGEEWREPNPFLYFVSHTDPELAEAVRKGRKEEFAAFHAAGEAPDPVSEKSFSLSKLQWHLSEEGEHKLMLNFYKTLIHLRRTHPALSTLNRQQLKVKADETKNILAIQRWQFQHKVVCVLNFSNKGQQSMPLSLDGKWHKLLDSAEQQWNGSSAAASVIDFTASNQAIYLQPESILIYSNHV
jgi:maltooligosyltrehalose trehalohydrolase